MWRADEADEADETDPLQGRAPASGGGGAGTLCPFFGLSEPGVRPEVTRRPREAVQTLVHRWRLGRSGRNGGAGLSGTVRTPLLFRR